MSRAPPSRFDIPRNLSYISGLYEKAYYASQRPGAGREEEEEETGASGSGSHQQQQQQRRRRRRRRRRARSLPARAELGRSRSPDTRKRVRFADSLGLELAAVKRFSQWEAPRVPSHVQAQLQRDAIRHFATCQPDCSPPRPLEPTFANPICSVDFLQRVGREKVCLEGVAVERFRLWGTVRVLNLAFRKEVTVRHTVDDWRSYSDTPASYIPQSADRQTDRFSFELALPPYLAGSSVQLAVRYRAGQAEYWDNDGGRNYRLRPALEARPSLPPVDCDTGWVHFV
ncbi:protein phosphatase 1 regulatory subunit 3E-like [Carcharodon carcharias]|uniref:protein phosphatase 1 regulatory subunit 3E-like n=1 Tax=Carcharodon carcharias TaxID=13397 RepID=UPI001B7E69B1|nr:protein phosphatase 1 regulatory subunit 3E-like [Carcharodon carcharias]